MLFLVFKVYRNSFLFNLMYFRQGASKHSTAVVSLGCNGMQSNELQILLVSPRQENGGNCITSRRIRFNRNWIFSLFGLLTWRNLFRCHLNSAKIKVLAISSDENNLEDRIAAFCKTGGLNAAIVIHAFRSRQTVLELVGNYLLYATVYCP